MEKVRTQRLELVPATLDLVLAEMEDLQRLSALLECEMPPSWPPEEKRDALGFFANLHREGGPQAAGWLGWYAIWCDEARRVLVGDAGFKGLPDEAGNVEIGYSTLAEYRRRGFATEAVCGLAEWAFAQGRVSRIVAEVVDGNQASVGVLVKAGFRSAGPGSEPNTLQYELLRDGSGAEACDA